MVVFSTPAHSDDAGQTICPVKDFICPTVGFAHTVVLTAGASSALTERVGEGFSVFNQAVRTYNPGFDPHNDPWLTHPLATAWKIQNWEFDRKDSFIDFLVQQTLRLSWPRDVLEGELMPFQTVKMHAAEHAHKRAIKSAAKSRFEKTALVYNALLMLRGYYVPMHLEDGDEKRKAYQQKLNDLRLEDEQCFDHDGAKIWMGIIIGTSEHVHPGLIRGRKLKVRGLVCLQNQWPRLIAWAIDFGATSLYRRKL